MTISGAKAVAEVFREEGVGHVFHLPVTFPPETAVVLDGGNFAMHVRRHFDIVEVDSFHSAARRTTPSPGSSAPSVLVRSDRRNWARRCPGPWRAGRGAIRFTPGAPPSW